MTNEPFAPFVPQPPMFEEPPAAARPKRGPRKLLKMAKKIHALTKSAVATTARPKRGPRVPKTDKHLPVNQGTVPPWKLPVSPEAGQKLPRQRKARKPQPVKIAIGILPHLAGLKPDEAKLLMSLIGNLQDASKKSRKRIVAALGSVFT